MSKLSDILKQKNVSVGIFGVGKSNIGVIEYIKKINPSIRITLRTDNHIEQNEALSAERIFCGKNALCNIDEDVLFLSPSVKRTRPEISDAQCRGIIISSDAELFFEKTHLRPICITGSDGKSTTTHLISQAFNLSGIPAVPCGNYGRSLCTVVDEPIFPIIEFSSFQLNYMAPHSSVAVITNITPNHLNWHSSLEEYVGAKMNLTYNADKVIFDADSDITSTHLKKLNVFAKTSIACSYEKLKAIGGSENYVTFKNKIIYVNGSPFSDISEAKRKETYNVRNFLLTVSACMCNCSEKAISESINSFSGLSHRAEEFFRCEGIRYIDSSIDSSPERTLKTLSALTEKPVVIIGGLGKGLPLSELAIRLPHLTRGAVLLGEVGSKLAELLALNNNDYRFFCTSDMKEAVKIATDIAKPSGTVILSPAATSFDKYKNFSERGNDYKRCVLSLFN